MNRALGFGIIATSGAAAMVATPTPASAHEVAIDSDCASAWVTSNHHRIWLWDDACPNVAATTAQFTMSGNPKEVLTMHTPRGEAFYFETVSQTIASFRKCHRYTNNTTACSGWIEVT